MADNKEEMEVITLEFDDGEELECEVIGIFDFEGEDFIAVAPDDESGEVFIYGYKETEDDFEMTEIEDDAKFDAVVAEFERIVGECSEEDEECGCGCCH